MSEVYFSHSYRDVAINSHFLSYFLGEDLPLRADQKTDIWCVAKLERYLCETSGFISVIPRRPTDKDAGAYSPYIGHELNLARRARVPRLLFVDDQVLKLHRLNFPRDAISFRSDALDADKASHVDAINNFRKNLEVSYRPGRTFDENVVTLISPGGPTLKECARDIAEVLDREGYSVRALSGPFQGRALDDIRLLESIWHSELCVCLLGDRLSDAHVALAMAHANFIPSIRLRYDKGAIRSTASVNGVIHWQEPNEMVAEFSRQIISYREGLVSPFEVAPSTSTTEVARSLGTMKWPVRDDNIWKLANFTGLVSHIHPEHSFIQDQVNRMQRRFRKPPSKARGRSDSMEIGRLLYDGIKRLRFAYADEPPTGLPADSQAIRTPSQIETHRTATCLDLVCMFASLLEAAGQRPLVLIVEGANFTHALAGWIALDEPPWQKPTLGDLRRAVELNDAVVFEATGAAEAESPVGDERDDERREKQLIFSDARTSAERTINRDDFRLHRVVDMVSIREQRDLSPS